MCLLRWSPGEREKENALTTADKTNAVVGGQGTWRYLEMETGVAGNGQGKSARYEQSQGDTNDSFLGV